MLCIAARAAKVQFSQDFSLIDTHEIFDIIYVRPARCPEVTRQ